MVFRVGILQTRIECITLDASGVFDYQESDQPVVSMIDSLHPGDQPG
jgi:hypothetical protein